MKRHAKFLISNWTIVIAVFGMITTTAMWVNNVNAKIEDIDGVVQSNTRIEKNLYYFMGKFGLKPVQN